MKKLAFILLISLLLPLAMQKCEAADVWVAHWESDNVDIYVVDDTLISHRDSTGKSFKVTTKSVRNGKLIRLIKWDYFQDYSDMWRYESSLMDGSHSTAAHPTDAVFEFCMHKLGWGYRVQEFWYY